MQKHIMIDIETMGNTSDSVIVSIGAVEFDLEKGLGRELYTNVSIQSCLDKGLKITESTLLWWLQQSKEQIEAFTKDTIPLGPALQGLRAFYLSVSLVRYVGEDPRRPWVWGNGASFDITILENAYRACGIRIPWDFYNVACYRTLKKVFNKVKKPVGEQVDKHNALSDAKFQAQHALEILKYKKILEEQYAEKSTD